MEEFSSNADNLRMIPLETQTSSIKIWFMNEGPVFEDRQQWGVN